MSGNLFFMPKQIAIDNGAVVPGAKLYFYQTGTSTPQNTYQDLELLTAHANPVVADANGEFDPIYFDPSFGDYRVTLTDSDDVQIWQEDDIPAGSSGRTITLTDGNPFIEFVESNASSENGVWRVSVNNEQFKIQVSNDAKDTAVNALTIDRTANTVDTINLLSTDLQKSGVNIEPRITALTTFGQWQSSTTYADLFADVSLEASTIYAFEISFILNTDATPDFKFRLHTADTLTLNSNPIGMFTVLDETAGTVQGGGISSALDSDFTIDGSAGDQFVTIRGKLDVNAAGSFVIQGAQNTSDATSTEIAAGFVFSIQKIG